MKLIIASNNAHKLVEIKAILGDRFDEILSLREAGIEHETVEDGMTFLENAAKKAREIAALSGCCALADDSGLCVDALGGAPGIYSARYSGVHGDDKANNRKLLTDMKDVPDEERGAHFTCAIVLARPDGTEVSAEGFFYGVIAHGESGSNGFGYDPLFLPDGWDRTFAELPREVKCTFSHRARAADRMRPLLRSLFPAVVS